MKFSALLVAVSFVASSAALAVPEDALGARAGFGGFGGFGNGQGKGAAQGGNAAAAAKASQAAAAAKASQAAAAAKASQAAAAAAASQAAAKGSNNAGSGAAASSGNNAAASGSGNSGDLQSSLTLDSSVIQTVGTGQNPPVAGQSNAAVSQNNFINFCAPGLPNVPITNGLQTTTGSCNPTPIGNIPSTANMPSAKFQSPTNGDTIAANTPFVVTLGVKNIQLGTFTNAAQTYFANPQTLNSAGQIIGHTHIVMEAIPSLSTTQITNPNKFQFFKGIDNAQDSQGNVQVNVTAGLPAGFYRFGTIMSSATHQPVIVPIAQHGLVDDVIYVTVSANGAATGNNNAGGGAAAGAGAASTTAAGATSTTAAAGGKTGATGKTGTTGKTGAKGATGANKGANRGRQ